jgi:hypothetical protein
MKVVRLCLSFFLCLGIISVASAGKVIASIARNGLPANYWKLDHLVDLTNRASTIDQLEAIANEIELEINRQDGDTCKEPSVSDYKLLCSEMTAKTKAIGTATDTVEYRYEQIIWKVACAKMGRDDLETAKRKIQVWWNKYKTNCKCDSINFTVPNGNLLKFSINQSLPDFINTLVVNYDLDINFIDPTDGKNVLDYLNDEIQRFKDDGISKASIKIYEDYRITLIKLGAKPSK